MKNQADRKYVLKWAKKIRAIEYKGGKCLSCGNDNIYHLEYHHRISNQKESSLSCIFDRRWSRIKTELDKCDLLCRNCHYEHHYLVDKNKDLRIRRLKENLLECYGSKECCICGYDKCSRCLDFHHKYNKSFGICSEVKSRKKITDRIIAEIDKCDLLCSNCHNEHHVDKERFESLEDEIFEKVHSMVEKAPSYKDDVSKLKKEGYRQFEIVNILGCAKSTVSEIWNKI